MSDARIIVGDCLTVIPTLDAESVDAIVTDPPYGLSFMGKDWDHGIPGEHFWREALRVAKPGAHLLAFGGTRTFHRLMVAIEDAGWEIRDCIGWLYGSGFPKSLDVSKAIDKANGREFSDRYALGRHIREQREAAGLSRAQVNAWFGYDQAANHWESQDARYARVPTLPDWQALRDRLNLSAEFLPLVERTEAEREVIGKRTTGIGTGRGAVAYIADTANIDITAPATDAAKQWAGWGTALKPAWEPIIVARKPLMGTVAANVQRFGTGALNIDGCRIQTSNILNGGRYSDGKIGSDGHAYGSNINRRSEQDFEQPTGRWPANLILSWPEDEYELRRDVTAEQKRELFGWLGANA